MNGRVVALVAGAAVIGIASAVVTPWMVRRHRESIRLRDAATRWNDYRACLVGAAPAGAMEERARLIRLHDAADPPPPGTPPDARWPARCNAFLPLHDEPELASLLGLDTGAPSFDDLDAIDTRVRGELPTPRAVAATVVPPPPPDRPPPLDVPFAVASRDLSVAAIEGGVSFVFAGAACAFTPAGVSCAVAAARPEPARVADPLGRPLDRAHNERAVCAASGRAYGVEGDAIVVHEPGVGGGRREIALGPVPADAFFRRVRVACEGDALRVATVTMGGRGGLVRTVDVARFDVDPATGAVAGRSSGRIAYDLDGAYIADVVALPMPSGVMLVDADRGVHVRVGPADAIATIPPVLVAATDRSDADFVAEWHDVDAIAVGARAVVVATGSKWDAGPRSAIAAVVDDRAEVTKLPIPP